MTSSIVIFNGVTESLEVVTDWFLEGDFIYLEAFNIGGGELELDAFLNAVINGVTRIIPLERITDTPPYQANQLDTELLFLIPSQFREANINKRIIFYPSEATQLKITVVVNEAVINRVEEKIQEIEVMVSQLLNILGGGGIILRGVLSFDASTYSVNENGAAVTPITIVRANGSDGQVEVTLAPSDGTATAPDDYNSTPITVIFLDKETSKVVTIPIVDNLTFGGNKTINLTLLNPTNGAALGNQTTAVLTIIENELPQFGTLSFSSSTYSVNENGTAVTPITIVRTNGSDGQVQVTLTPSDGTATAPEDYNSTPITVTFNQGETLKTVTIPIVDNAIFENNETIDLTLSNPTGGATLGNPSAITAVLTIVDNDVDTAFISTWNTNNTTGSVTANNQIRLPLVSNGAYNFTVEWGDNTSDVITVWNQAQTTHTYASSGSYTVRITGTIVGFRFANAGDRTKITNISQWGVLRLGNGGNYFQGCTNLTVTATGPLDLTGTTNLTSMFSGCTNFNGAIGNWNVSSVTTMNSLFQAATNFNQPLNNWDVANVTNMNLLFQNAANFNQPLNNWKTNKVTGMTSMFQNAIRFNQNLSTWCVTLIPTAPSSFDGNTPAWQGKPGTLPQWGTCPNP